MTKTESLAKFKKSLPIYSIIYKVYPIETYAKLTFICISILECLNVRSLLGKTDQLEFLMTKLNIDILCLSETWLHPSVGKENVKIKG